MSLIYCPECGHEISTAAVACPGCGRPISKPGVTPKIVVDHTPKRESIPPYVIVPVVILGVLVLFGLIYVFTRDGDDANSNLSVNVNARRPASTQTVDSDTVTTTVPGSSVTTAPMPSDPTSVTTVPGSQVNMPTNGTVLIDAKVQSRTGSPQAVRNARFYLLDKDVETILSDADVEPIEGQSMMASLGMSVADPSRYGSFYQEALRAMKDHIKYTGSTDSAGKAQLGSVKPDSYYLFGVTRAGDGFAIWNSPVSVTTGDNIMNLSPPEITQMPSANS